MTFKPLMLPQPPKLEKVIRAFLQWNVDWLYQTQEKLAPCSLWRTTTRRARLSFGGLSVRTLPPANAEGRERCPSKTAFLSATEFTSILVASLRFCGCGAVRPTEPQGSQ